MINIKFADNMKIIFLFNLLIEGYKSYSENDNFTVNNDNRKIDEDDFLKLLLSAAKQPNSKDDNSSLNTETRKIKENSFLKNYSHTEDKTKLNKLKIMTLNTNTKELSNRKKQQMTIFNLINKHRPNILALQELEEFKYYEIKTKINNKKYDFACEEAKFLNIGSKKVKLQPIIYGKKSLLKIKDYVFRDQNYKYRSYGCMCIFYMKSLDLLFSVININLPNLNEKDVYEKTGNILAYLNQFEFKDFPIFIVGTINQLSHIMINLTEIDFKNLNPLDSNKKYAHKRNFQKNHGSANNIQKDFILLKDKLNKFKLNHIKNLSGYSNFEHGPLLAILNKS